MSADYGQKPRVSDTSMNARDMNLQLIDVLEKPVLNQKRNISLYCQGLRGRHFSQGRTIILITHEHDVAMHA